MTTDFPNPLMPAEGAALVTQVDDALAAANALTIDSNELYKLAAEDTIAAGQHARKLEELRRSLTQPIDEHKARIMQLFSGPIERARAVVDALKRKMIAYDQEQAAARQRAEREAREKAEAERRAAAAREHELRAQAELEARAAQQQREEAIAVARKSEQAAAEAQLALKRARDLQTAEEAARAKAEADKQAAAARAEEEKAAARQQAADQQAAEASNRAHRMELLPVVAAVPSEVMPASVAGLTRRMNYKAEVLDVNALIRAAAAGLERGETMLAGLLLPNVQAIGALARSTKGAATVPGVRIYAERALATRTKS